MQLVLGKENIDMDRPGRMSASRLSTGFDCARLYQHKHVKLTKPDPKKYKKPDPLKGHLFGSSVHAEIEDLFSGQVSLLPRHQKIRDMAKKMKDSQTFIKPKIEVRFAILMGSIWFYGFIDVLDTLKPIVLDWKTSSDPEQYSITPSEFYGDPQAVIYSAVMFLLRPELGSVNMSFVYGSSVDGTVGPIVTVRMQRERTLAALESFRDMAEALLAGEDEQNFEACSNYGGCAYKSQCTQTWEQLLGF